MESVEILVREEEDLECASISATRRLRTTQYLDKDAVASARNILNAKRVKRIRQTQIEGPHEVFVGVPSEIIA
jgi:hypothetical protein